jgi:catechol 2,3-dioxygenase-like lactoylglutathione lyase family enzyme
MTTSRDLLKLSAPAGTDPQPLADELASAQAGAPPRMLHHTAYVTHDTAATVDFYTRVLRMRLVSTVIDDAVPSTGDPFPYIHLFFELQDGSTIAFFESLDLPDPAVPTHPAYNIFNHLALDAGSKEAVDAWAGHLREQGVEVLGPIDHHIIYSIYFHDPTGLRLELTATVVPSWKDHHDQAVIDVADWTRLKEQMKLDGDSAAAIEWIKQRRARHKHEESLETETS